MLRKDLVINPALTDLLVLTDGVGIEVSRKVSVLTLLSTSTYRLVGGKL